MKINADYRYIENAIISVYYLYVIPSPFFGKYNCFR
jgi:hypothetical protein